jgi:hypothetical protein
MQQRHGGTELCPKPILRSQQSDVHRLHAVVRTSSRRDCYHWILGGSDKFHRAAECDGLLSIIGSQNCPDAMVVRLMALGRVSLPCPETGPVRRFLHWGFERQGKNCRAVIDRPATARVARQRYLLSRGSSDRRNDAPAESAPDATPRFGGPRLCFF